MKSILASLLTIFILSFPAISQLGMTKYQYSTSEGIHARALLWHQDHLIIGCNTGQIFSQYIDSNAQTKHWETSSYAEIRDLTIFNRQLVALSSGDSSALLFYDMETRALQKTINFPGVFLDGMSVHNNELFLMGDPVNGFFSLYQIESGSYTPKAIELSALPGEAGFAGSGSTVQFGPKGERIFVSGGKHSRFHIQDTPDSPFESKSLSFDDSEGSGPFSISLGDIKKKRSTWVIVGGDYSKPNDRTNTCYISKNKGNKWKASKGGTLGYRCSVIYANGNYFACGTNGLDVSMNKGKTWNQLTNSRGFSLCENGEDLFVSQANGTILKLGLNSIE
jgi:hypothetical protein